MAFEVASIKLSKATFTPPNFPLDSGDAFTKVRRLLAQINPDSVGFTQARRKDTVHPWPTGATGAYGAKEWTRAPFGRLRHTTPPFRVCSF
jgi:hypothetical protein